MIGEQRGHVIPIRVLPIKALGRGGQERSGENDGEGGVIRTGWRAEGVPGGEIREQSSIGKGQVKNCRAMIRGEWKPSVDPRVLKREIPCADDLSK